MGGPGSKKSERGEKGQANIAFSVSVLSGFAWTFDVVYGVDQREEINTNISAAWPAEHLSDHLFTFLHFLVLQFCICLNTC